MTFMLTYEELESRNAQLEDRVDSYLAENESLAKACREWEDTFDAMMDPVMVVDGEHNLVRANKATVRAFNRPAEEIIGRKYWEVIYGQDRPIADCPLVLAEKALRAHSKEIDQTPLGGTFLLSAALIISDTGRFGGYCVTLKDMTALKRRQRQERQDEKMAAVSTLSGDIAHEFNNLLAGIQGTTSMLLAGTDKEDPNYEKLRRVENFIETGHELTKQLLGFSTKDTYETELMDLNRLVEKTWDNADTLENGIHVRKMLEEGLWLSRVDAGQIEQVLIHLYTNAREAMPQGGELNVSTENVVFDKNYADFFGVPEGNYVKLTLTDTGEGMDHETEEMMFNPFFTTRTHNTGLGLTFAQRIVANHGGLINVYSEKGRGTAVNIYLPAARKAQLDRTPPSNQVVKGTETVLLVDDERIILEVGGEMLRELGYRVHAANGGQEAVRVYTDLADDIDLVILDMIMPDMDGRKTYERLREINPNVKVLLASGYSVTSQVTEILKGGFNGFIQKPFNMLRLSKKMRSVLESSG